jgi:hypothetical protein
MPQHRRSALVIAAAMALICVGPRVRAAGDYPRTIVAQAKTTDSGTTVTSTITIKLNRLMEPSRRTRVLDGLKYNGYQGFMNALRPLPVIGTIATPKRSVNVRYAWESEVEGHRRLVVVSNTPLFFLPGDTEKAKAGYELTFVELFFDASGGGRGTMSGATRVKPAPDGIVIEDFAVAPVDLTVAAPATPKS